MVNGKEIKYVSVALPGSLTSSVTAGDFAANISQGPSFLSQRIGNIIEPVRFLLDGTLRSGDTNTLTDDAYNTVRISVVWAVPGTSFATYSIGSILGPRECPGLLGVIFDKKIDLVSSGRDTVGYVPAVKSVRFNVKVNRNNFIVFSGTGANSDTSATIYLLEVSDSYFPNHPGWVGGSAMLQYVDN